ncbi:MAG: hypothetical protein GY801_47835 [bacterium]|nr:hypothetical protein [bacterium]
MANARLTMLDEPWQEADSIPTGMKVPLLMLEPEFFSAWGRLLNRDFHYNK